MERREDDQHVERLVAPSRPVEELNLHNVLFVVLGIEFAGLAACADLMTCGSSNDVPCFRS